MNAINNFTPRWEQVTLKDMQKDKIYVYIKDTSTGDIYWSDDRSTVAGKCCLIFIGNIAATFVRCTYYFLKPTWKIPQIVMKAFADLAKIFSENTCQTLGDFAIRVTIKLPLSLVKSVVGIARSIISGVLVELAIFAIFKDPYDARKYIAKIEYAMNLGYSYKVSIPNQFANCDGNSSFSEIHKMIRKTKSFYLAWCFQPRGNIKDLLSNGHRKFVAAAPL